MTVKRLDIGSGTNKIPGALYLDKDPAVHPDILHDLNKFPYPLKDQSFDEIYAKHIIEHLNDPQRFLLELCRALKPGGTLFIETPHFSNYVSYTEVEHQRTCSYYLIVNLVRPTSLEITLGEITFHKIYRHLGVHFLANRHPRGYERFWAFIFPAENIKFWLKKRQ